MIPDIHATDAEVVVMVMDAIKEAGE